MEVISLSGACQISRKAEKWERGREATGGWTAKEEKARDSGWLKMGAINLSQRGQIKAGRKGDHVGLCCSKNFVFGEDEKQQVPKTVVIWKFYGFAQRLTNK